MPSCRQRWLGDLRRSDTTQSTWRISVWASASDTATRDHAVSVGAVIVTKDEDFAIRQLLVGGPSIVWLRLGNTRRAALLGRIEADLPAIVAALERGETLVEIV